MTRRSILASAAALCGAGAVMANAPASTLEALCAAVKLENAASGAGPGPFIGTICFEPVELDQVAFEYPLNARTLDEAFAESDWVAAWFAAQGFPNWSTGCSGPWRVTISPQS